MIKRCLCNTSGTCLRDGYNNFYQIRSASISDEAPLFTEATKKSTSLSKRDRVSYVHTCCVSELATCLGVKFWLARSKLLMSDEGARKYHLPAAPIVLFFVRRKMLAGSYVVVKGFIFVLKNCCSKWLTQALLTYLHSLIAVRLSWSLSLPKFWRGTRNLQFLDHTHPSRARIAFHNVEYVT